jgi:hypothetical protein
VRTIHEIAAPAVAAFDFVAGRSGLLGLAGRRL